MADLYGIPRKQRIRKAVELLRQFELKERAEHLPAELSGGEQQRVTISRALINDPDVILADEPTGELDTQTAAIIVGLLKELNSEGKTIVLATHDLGLARQVTTQVHLEDGKVIRMEKNPPATMEVTEKAVERLLARARASLEVCLEDLLEK